MTPEEIPDLAKYLPANDFETAELVGITCTIKHAKIKPPKGRKK